jgi:uncharacterized membrane protein YfcA
MILLVVIGLIVGALGTLVGAGGGFLLLPLLLWLYPGENTERITAISLAVVFANALSGTIAYTRMRNVDFYAGLRFALAALPGAYLGALSTSYIPRLWFDRSLGCFLVIIACYLLYRAFAISAIPDTHQKFPDTHQLPSEKFPEKFPDTHQLPSGRNSRGLVIGCLLSAGVGFIASILGIGGGIIHVPALIYLLGFPVHMATATSHFVLTCTSAVAVSEHIWHGSYSALAPRVFALAAGAIGGAQLGARASKRVKGQVIITGLAIALIMAGVRIVLHTL